MASSSEGVGPVEPLVLGPMLRHLVSRYATHKVRERRFTAAIQASVRSPSISCHPSLAALLLRIAGDEVLVNERTIREPFSIAAAERIIAENKHLFSDEAYDQKLSLSISNLAAIIKEMGDLIFEDRKHWGKVAAFLAFAGTVAAYCTEKKNIPWITVSDVVTDAFAEYVEQNLRQWVLDNGGPDVLNSALNEGTKYYNDAVWRRIGYSQLLQSTSKAFVKKRDYASAKCSLELALRIHKIFSIEYKKQAELLYDIGMVLSRQFAYREALETFDRARELRVSVIGNTNDTFVADCLFHMGFISAYLKDFTNSVSYHESALSMRELLDQGSSKTAESYLFVAHMNYYTRHYSWKSGKTKKRKQHAINLIEIACNICKALVHSQDRETLVHVKGLLRSASPLCTSASLLPQKEVARKAKSLSVEIATLLDIVHQRLVGLGECDHSDHGMLHHFELLTTDDSKEEGIVPPGTITLGPETLDAYQKALDEGEARVRRVPVMLIGQERAGKTSLKKSLKGETFDPNEERTRGADIDPSLFKVTTDVWKAGSTGSPGEDTADAVSFEFHAAKLTLQHLKAVDKDTGYAIASDTLEERDGTEEERPSFQDRREEASNTNEASETLEMTEKKTDEENLGVRDLNIDPAQSEDQPGNSQSDVKDESGPQLGKQEIPDEVAQLITKLQNEEMGEDDEEAIYCTLWDFAGQSVFYATHSLFLTHRAIYLLVNDLSKPPHQEADPLVRQGLFKKIRDSSLARTNMDFLHFWMNSVASLAEGKKGSSSCPPVIFVSTHADKPYAAGCPRDLAREVYGNLQSKPYKSHLVDDFFVVDNSRSGSEEEDPEVSRLRVKVQETAGNLQDAYERIPVKWLRLEKSLKMSVEEGFNYLTCDAVEKIARDVCGIADAKAFRAALDFLHEQRVLVHFDDTSQLDDLVIINPQWLIDVFKEVITIRPFEEQQSPYKEHWKQLEDTGILKKDLLEHVWSHLVTDQDTVEALVVIMERFSLLCRWPSLTTEESYLVPHMMMSHPQSEDLEQMAINSGATSIFVRLFNGPNLQMLFPNLLVGLIREWPEEWSTQRQPELHRNAARFFLDSHGGYLILFCQSDVIEVSLHSPTTTSSADVAELCSRVHDILWTALEGMRTDCRWMRLTQFDLCFRCPVCCENGKQKARCKAHRVTDCPEVECLHFFSVTEIRGCDQPIRCERPVVAGDAIVPVEAFSCWFDKTTDEADGAAAQGISTALLSDVTSLSIVGADPTDIVQKITESLELDEGALEEPTSGTVQKVRGLAELMVKRGRADVVQELRKVVPSGTTGGDEWKVMADKLQFSAVEIRFLDNRAQNPAEAILVELERRNQKCTVGSLYDVLVECEMPSVADIM